MASQGPGGVQLASFRAPPSLTLATGAVTLKQAVQFPMATIDEDLGQLEKDIRQLKIEYEQYFAGGRKRPPTDIEWRVELLVKRYGERNSQMNYGQRFRFNGLTQTHAKYREMFRKRLKQKEEATVIRHFGAAAKEIEAQRAGRAAQPESTVATASVLVQKEGSRPPTEDSEVRKLYESFRDAKTRVGEDTSQFTFDNFQDFLARKKKQFREKTDDGVEFVVEVKDGRARLKARMHKS
jgi:hypothetical protein